MSDPTAQVVAQATAEAFKARIGQLCGIILAQADRAEYWRHRCSVAESEVITLSNTGWAAAAEFYRERAEKLEAKLALMQLEIESRREP